MAQDTLQVKVYSQFKVYYEGAAESVSAISQVGSFDILPYHANFFTLLVAGNVVIASGGKSTEVPVSHGVMQVADNVVKVFVDV
jgi:F0F1-type ATP synthase epsilon subunit